MCVLVWGSFSSPEAGGLFRGCRVAAYPCPHVSVETPPPYVGFSSGSPSVQLSIPRKGVGGREMTRAPPRGPSRSAGIPPRRRKEEGKMGHPRREGDGHQRRGGAENSHPHQEMVVERGQEGSDSLQDAGYDHSDIDASGPASTGCNRPFGKRRNFGTCTGCTLVGSVTVLLYLHNYFPQSFFPNMICYYHLSPLLNRLLPTCFHTARALSIVIFLSELHTY